MNGRQLFRAAILSRKLYRVVADYLDHLNDFGPDEEPDDEMVTGVDGINDSVSPNEALEDDLHGVGEFQLHLLHHFNSV